MAPQEEPSEVAGEAATANPAHAWEESGGRLSAKANPILRGWHGYFRESHPTGLSGPDGWLRRRLRAMLRKREKRPGYGLSKADSHRWPNRWFAVQGLFSLQHGSCAYG